MRKRIREKMATETIDNDLAVELSPNSREEVAKKFVPIYNNSNEKIPQRNTTVLVSSSSKF